MEQTLMKPFFMNFVGNFDIKQSLSLKSKRERLLVLKIPDEVDTATVLMLGMQEIKIGNLDNGVLLLSKAILFLYSI